MKVGILQCGEPPEVLGAEYGSYGAMVQKLLGAGRNTAIYDVTAGALRPAPPLATPTCSRDR